MYHILEQNKFNPQWGSYIFREDYDFYNSFYVRKSQIGGSGIIKFNYNNKIYDINYTYDNYNYIYSLQPLNSDNNEIRNCFLIYIDKKDTSYAYITNISSYNDCPHVGYLRNGRGSHLLKVIIAFIESLKEKYGLKYIQLKDNSYLQCKQIGQIELDSLYMLTQGDTWYGKYRFRPFNTYKKDLDIDRYIDYRVNSILVDKIKINCTNLKELMKKAIRENKTEFTEEGVERVISKYGKLSIKDFFKKFLSKFEVGCELFFYIYKDFMDSVGIKNLHGISYFLDLEEIERRKQIVDMLNMM